MVSSVLSTGRIAALLAGLVLGSQALADTQIRFEIPSSVPSEVTDAILAASLLAEAARTEKTDVQELLADARADYERILAALYQDGRFGGVVNILVDGREAATIPPLANPPEIDLIVARVLPGPLYRFSNVGAAPLAQQTELPEEFARGEPAGVDAIREAADTAIEAWRQAGHAKAEVSDQRIVARHNAREVDAALRLAPGPRLSFGTVGVSGNKDVRTRRIRTIAGLEEGRTFDPDELRRAERRLRRTGSFRSVRVVEGDEVAPGDRLPLTIEVVEQTPRRFGFGAEYSTIEGATLSGFWLHRNFLGGAERFRVDTEISGIGGETGGVDYDLGVRYERPATPRPDVDLFATFGVELLDEPDFTSDTVEFTLGFTRYATDDLTVDFGLGYLYSEVEDDFGTETYSLITAPLGAVYDRRRNPLNPKDGYFVDLEMTPFYGISGTSAGLRTELDARGYESFGENESFTFATRLQLGSLAGPDLLDSPPFYRFYSGGGGTVRGQDYQSLAVDLGGDDRTGGRSFFGASVELRADVTEAIEVVGFYDYGYIGTEAFPDFSGDSHAGAGLGLRYNTGIGPIRLDVAVPVSGDTEASDYYVYIGIGQAF
ncbi:autotransporter assembly complex protein TamA [Kangsaoukella pontilimi]|uniref:autotransporter assembly complex protein TamA n=1 Tax=Kangsaoukella pontilimi TaxID=2691042 RepID=UPI001D09D76D|nr:autotransporter assembly complex family protein [Kangsaoukella pontilimi]